MHQTGNSIKLLTGASGVLGLVDQPPRFKPLLIVLWIVGNSHPKLADAVAARYVPILSRCPVFPIHHNNTPALL
jgi:hypothetical protein